MLALPKDVLTHMTRFLDSFRTEDALRLTCHTLYMLPFAYIVRYMCYDADDLIAAAPCTREEMIAADTFAADDYVQYKAYVHGVLHSVDDEPAYKTDIYHIWYWRGKVHRDGDKPAEVDCNGTKYLCWRDQVCEAGQRPI
jgi:hypothetical protein